MRHLYMADGSVNPALFDNKIIIYGCGNDGRKLYLQIGREEGKNQIAYFCDSNRELTGKELYGIKILSYEQLSDYQNYNLVLAFHQYPQVTDLIPEKMKQNIFADYLFEHSEKRTCILCGQDNCTYDRAHFAPFLTERMFLGNQQSTRLIHCLNCGLYYSDYRPTEQEVQRLYNCYRDEKYVEQRKKYEPDYNNELYSDIEYHAERKKDVLEFLDPFINFEKIGNVLDYGGDEGQYIPDQLSGADRYVYDISGNQPLPNVTLLSTLESLKQIKWDFILCMHLLEHLSNPQDTLRILAELLENHSYLYIELPRDDYMYQYSDVEINEHINFFQESTMYKISDLFRLRIVNMKIEDAGIIRVLYQKA